MVTGIEHRAESRESLCHCERLKDTDVFDSNDTEVDDDFMENWRRRSSRGSRSRKM